MPTTNWHDTWTRDDRFRFKVGQISRSGTNMRLFRSMPKIYWKHLKNKSQNRLTWCQNLSKFWPKSDTHGIDSPVIDPGSEPAVLGRRVPGRLTAQDHWGHPLTLVEEDRVDHVGGDLGTHQPFVGVSDTRAERWRRERRLLSNWTEMKNLGV